MANTLENTGNANKQPNLIRTLIYDVFKLKKKIDNSSTPLQVNADWNATNGVAEILNKPIIIEKNHSVTDVSNAFTFNILTDFLYLIVNNTLSIVTFDLPLPQYRKDGFICKIKFLNSGTLIIAGGIVVGNIPTNISAGYVLELLYNQSNDTFYVISSNVNNSYITSVQVLGNVPTNSSFVIGNGMSIPINQGNLFNTTNNRFVNTTNKPLMVHIDGGISYGIVAFTSGTSSLSMQRVGTNASVKQIALPNKDSNNYLNIKFSHTEILQPNDYLLFVLFQTSGSVKQIVSDSNTYFNINSIELS